MQEIEQKWEKDGIKIDIKAYGCLCGGEMRMLGSAGCSHNSEWTYFYQCEKCLRVDSSSWERPSSMYETNGLIAAGWKRVIKK